MTSISFVTRAPPLPVSGLLPIEVTKSVTSTSFVTSSQDETSFLTLMISSTRRLLISTCCRQKLEASSKPSSRSSTLFLLADLNIDKESAIKESPPEAISNHMSI